MSFEARVADRERVALDEARADGLGQIMQSLVGYLRKCWSLS